MCVYLGTKFKSYEMDEGMNLTPTPSTTTTPPRPNCKNARLD